MRARFDLDDATYFSIIYKIESQSGNLAHLRNAYVRQIRIPTNSTFQYRSFNKIHIYYFRYYFKLVRKANRKARSVVTRS